MPASKCQALLIKNKECNNKQTGKSGLFFLSPDGDPDQSHNLIGSKMDQVPASLFFSGRSKQKNGQRHRETGKQSWG